MAKKFTTNRLSPERAAMDAPVGALALARLARVLGRQAAREQLTPHTSLLIPQTDLQETNER